jgi:hypothetical protein
MKICIDYFIIFLVLCKSATLSILIIDCKYLLYKVWRISYLGIRPSGNLHPQKVPPLDKSVDSILEIFKIYVCVSLD